VEQRNAHLAGPVRLEYVNGREGKLAKGTLTAICNARRGSGDDREEEPTAIQGTLWGKQADVTSADDQCTVGDREVAMADTIRGGCLCGGVRFEVDPPFIRVGHCHCSRCRKHSGTFGLTQA
jgi:hypothetical protein